MAYSVYGETRVPRSAERASWLQEVGWQKLFVVCSRSSA
jgi:hypothetical protein